MTTHYSVSRAPLSAIWEELPVLPQVPLSSDALNQKVRYYSPSSGGNDASQQVVMSLGEYAQRAADAFGPACTGLVWHLSAVCRHDDEGSQGDGVADASTVASERRGIMTSALINVLTNHSNSSTNNSRTSRTSPKMVVTCSDLLRDMRSDLVRCGLTQAMPILFSSRPMDLAREPFTFDNLTGPASSKRKNRSLLIGIEYRKVVQQQQQRQEKGRYPKQLTGCASAVRAMHRLLTSQGWPMMDNSCRILTDDPTWSHGQPTADNIVRGLHWLSEVGDHDPTCCILVYFAGHHGVGSVSVEIEAPLDLTGANSRNSKKDNTLLPIDFLSLPGGGEIRGSTLLQILVAKLKAKLIFVCDAHNVHSTAMMDLPFCSSSSSCSSDTMESMSSSSVSPSFTVTTTAQPATAAASVVPRASSSTATLVKSPRVMLANSDFSFARIGQLVDEATAVRSRAEAQPAPADAAAAGGVAESAAVVAPEVAANVKIMSSAGLEKVVVNATASASKIKLSDEIKTKALRAFATFDTDNSSFLAPDEIRCSLMLLMPSASAVDIERKVKEVLRRGDANSDGVLSAEEFLDFYQHFFD